MLIFAVVASAIGAIVVRKVRGATRLDVSTAMQRVESGVVASAMAVDGEAVDASADDVRRQVVAA